MRFVLFFSICLAALSQLQAQNKSAQLDRRISEIRSRVAEERWRMIGFESSLTRALAEAKEVGRPVFFFGGDGDVDSGDC